MQQRCNLNGLGLFLRLMGGLLFAVQLGFAGASPLMAQTGQGKWDIAQIEPDGSSIAITNTGLDVTFALSAAVPHRVFTLSNPPRAVMDFREVNWSGLNPKTIWDGPGRAHLRFGMFRAGWSRLVIDLERDMRVEQVNMLTTNEGAQFAARLVPGSASEMPILGKVLHDAPIAKPDGGDGAVVVAIDPGHGGVDPGAIRAGVSEKDIALRFALELRSRLLQTGDFSVVLTRERDVFLSLSDRVRIAQSAGADVMLSIHANTVAQGDAYGATVYSLSEQASDAASAALAQLENRSDVSAGLDLSVEEDDVARALLDMARAETNPRSRRLAAIMVKALKEQIAVIRSRPHRSAGFLVLKAPDVPSLLLELGFLSDDLDRERMQKSEWRARAATGVINALYTWAEDDAERAKLRLK